MYWTESQVYAKVSSVQTLFHPLWTEEQWFSCGRKCHGPRASVTTFSWTSVRCMDGLVQDCSNSSASAMEILQSCTKPLNVMFTHLLTGWLTHGHSGQHIHVCMNIFHPYSHVLHARPHHVLLYPCGCFGGNCGSVWMLWGGRLLTHCWGWWGGCD